MMPSLRIRVRFAPSPTGELHVGNARTALFNWIFARHSGGAFIVRIEDTDRVRTSKAVEANLLDDLQWLGIDWDEGPGVGGPYGPYHQTERLDLYRASLNRLIEEGRVYPCYCTEEELEAERAELVARRMMPRYRGKCRKLTTEERNRFSCEGRAPVWRYRVEEGPIAFDDLIRGAMAFQGDAIGDFIIVRSNGVPAYNFAVVVDDHFMEVSHVIRGEDHLSNTAVQILLYRALGFKPPVFAHHSLILGADHTKLSKRHGAVSVGAFRRRGILPEVLLNYLALMGSSFEGGKELVSVQEIIEGFSLDRTGKSGAVFDEEKLLWLNGLYIRRYDPKTLTDLLMPFIRTAGYDENSFSRDRLERIVAAVQDNLPTLAAIGDFIEMFDDERYRIEEDAAALLRTDDAKRVLGAFQKELRKLGCSGGESLGQASDAATAPFLRGIGEWMRHNETGLKGKNLYLPIRAAVTGRLHGLELDRIFGLLGLTSLLRRVEKVLVIS